MIINTAIQSFSAGKNAKKGHRGQCQTPRTVDYTEVQRTPGILGSFSAMETKPFREMLKVKIYNSTVDNLIFQRRFPLLNEQISLT